jgi:hypothetical protein
VARTEIARGFFLYRRIISRKGFDGGCSGNEVHADSTTHAVAERAYARWINIRPREKIAPPYTEGSHEFFVRSLLLNLLLSY